MITIERARQSLGQSEDPIYRTVAAVLEDRGASGILADVGCGTGRLWPFVQQRFPICLGFDTLKYDGLSPGIEFHRVDLDLEHLPIASESVDTAIAVETIEHLENPRALVRELSRVTRRGGLIVVTTPNQLSWLSLLTLVRRGQFSAFQEGSYPAHRTALLEIDLCRIAAECGLRDARVQYTCSGRIPLTGAHYPVALSQSFPRRFSDNVVFSARRPER